MKSSGDNQFVGVPPALFAQIEEAAKAEHRTPEEVLQEAVERYLEDKRWQNLLVYGEQQARLLGLTDTDVPRLIDEYRKEHRQNR